MIIEIGVHKALAREPRGMPIATDQWDTAERL
jgi:hypothetical protein